MPAPKFDGGVDELAKPKGGKEDKPREGKEDNPREGKEDNPKEGKEDPVGGAGSSGKKPPSGKEQQQ